MQKIKQYRKAHGNGSDQGAALLLCSPCGLPAGKVRAIVFLAMLL